MYSLKTFGHKGGCNRAFGKALAREGLVGEDELVHIGFELGDVGARHLTYPLGADFRALAEGLLDDGAYALCRSGRGVKLVDMVYLLDVRGVTVALEDLAGSLDGGEGV